MKIIGIETDGDFYFKVEMWNFNISATLFDGVKAETTFKNNWYKIRKKPTKVEKIENGQRTNLRYELNQQNLHLNKLHPEIYPLVIKQTELEYDEDEDGRAIAKIKSTEMLFNSSLYTFKWDDAPSFTVPIEFSVDVILRVDNIKEYSNFHYPVPQERWDDSKTKPVITESYIKNYVMDEIIFPDILLPSKPCYLSSLTSYNIIREHVKANINGKYARVSSDYDFCFVVRKVIPCKESSYEVNIGTSKRPKMSKKYVNSREVECFEMTQDKDKYKGHTVIEGFRGKNQEDLKNNIDKYLADLIAMINEPVKECPNCNGNGVILAS